MRTFTRRRMLKSVAAAAAGPLGFPFLNLAHAQAAPVPIGVAVPLTGNAGPYGPDMAEAAKRTAAKINNAGGILGGRRLELFIEDSESSAAVAANLTQKFINVHKCQSCLGYWGTPEGMSSRPIVVQNKVVLMVSSAANAITEGDTQGYVWRFQMKATDWGIVIGRAAAGMKFKSVGILGLQNAFVLPIMKVFEERMKAAGVQVVDSLIYNPEQPSYRAEVERVFGKKPDAVFCFGLLPDFVSIIREVHRGGFESKVIALSIMADAEGKFVQAVGPQVAEGIRHFQPMPDVSASGYKKFVQLMGAPAGPPVPVPAEHARPDGDHRARDGAGEEPDGGGLVQADHHRRQRPRPGGRRRGRGAEAGARRKADQFPGCGIDVRLHPQRRPARPRHGPVDHQGRQERVRRVRKAVAAERAAGPEDEPQADADANFSAAARYGDLSSTRSPPR